MLLRTIASLLHQAPAAYVLMADAVFLLVFVLIAKWLSQYIFIYMLFVLPGTVAHELAHWVVAVVTNGKPKLPSLSLKRTRDGVLLGQVSFKNPQWYNAAFIALAPLLLLPLAAWLYLHATARIPLLHAYHWITLYLIIAAGFSALPSALDVRVAWKYSAPILLAITAAVLAVLFFGYY
jgi:hypothetical protein